MFVCFDFFFVYEEKQKNFFFFFSSRRRHTRLQGDWSSDVCSSDLPQQWREYFDRLQSVPGQNGGRDVAHSPVIAAFAQRAKAPAARPMAPVAGFDRKQNSVIQLIVEYRFRGVFLADIDPLKRHEPPRIPELDPAYYDLTDADMDTVFNTGTLIGPEQATLRDILKTLRDTYCGTLGVEYMYLSSRAEKRWIQE